MIFYFVVKNHYLNTCTTFQTKTSYQVVQSVVVDA